MVIGTQVISTDIVGRFADVEHVAIETVRLPDLSFREITPGAVHDGWQVNNK